MIKVFIPFYRVWKIAVFFSWSGSNIFCEQSIGVFKHDLSFREMYPQLCYVYLMLKRDRSQLGLVTC